MSLRVDIHEQITNRIIEAIEKGGGAFKLPWHRPAGSITRPTNIQSKKAYRGINVVTLWVEAQLRGFGAPVWGTYKQFQEAGCQVRKGEKASMIVFYKLCGRPHNELQVCVARSRRTNRVGLNAGGGVDWLQWSFQVMASVGIG